MKNKLIWFKNVQNSKKYTVFGFSYFVEYTGEKRVYTIVHKWRYNGFKEVFKVTIHNFLEIPAHL